jgi:hypothetical protein
MWREGVDEEVSSYWLTWREKRGYWKFKEEALGGKVWRNGFDMRYGPFVGQTNGWMNFPIASFSLTNKCRNYVGKRNFPFTQRWFVPYLWLCKGKCLESAVRVPLMTKILMILKWSIRLWIAVAWLGTNSGGVLLWLERWAGHLTTVSHNQEQQRQIRHQYRYNDAWYLSQFPNFEKNLTSLPSTSLKSLKIHGFTFHTATCTIGTGSFPGVKRPGRGIDHSPHLAPRLNEEQNYTSNPPLGLCGLF